jgi:hypothetical protein
LTNATTRTSRRSSSHRRHHHQSCCRLIVTTCNHRHRLSHRNLSRSRRHSFPPDADDLSSIPLPPTPLSADDERVARASIVIAPAEPPDDSGRRVDGEHRRAIVVDVEPHDTPPRASATMSIDSDFDVTGRCQ